ncbi:helix-turn-helix domain-containing protein [Clostridium tertium]
MEDVNSIFGKRLRLLRNEKNMTLDELAPLLEVTKSSLSRFENNLRKPSREFLLRCSKYFNCSIDYLNGLTDIRDITQDGKSKNLNTSLNKKDEKDIEKKLAATIAELETQDGLLLSGNVVDEEDMQFIIQAIKAGLEYAKMQNKLKHTPKKYRKD